MTDQIAAVEFCPKTDSNSHSGFLRNFHNLLWGLDLS